MGPEILPLESESTHGIGGFHDSSNALTWKQRRLFQAYDDAYKFETNDFVPEVIRGIAELRELFDEFRRVKLGNDHTESSGFLYFGSDTGESEEVCLAYTDLNETMLVRVGDEVVISQVDEVGYIREITYIPDLDKISCVIDLGEEYERLVEISPSAVFVNRTLFSESRLGD